MGERPLDELLEDERDGIVVAVRERMRGDETMGKVAAQRQLREGELVAQVLSFWLQAVRTDLALGSTTAVRQNLEWLASLRSGHELPFDDGLVRRVFLDVSAEVEARLETSAQRAQYTAYRDEVLRLIAVTFPG